MSYEDYIEDSWLALAAAIVSPKELTVNESLRLMGLKPLDTIDKIGDNYYGNSRENSFPP